VKILESLKIIFQNGKIDIWSIKGKECVREVKKDRPKEILLGMKRTIEANSRS
jgi:hypothetical protein